jgi:diguanylate cyclase (GGDEF)-like protein
MAVRSMTGADPHRVEPDGAIEQVRAAADLRDRDEVSTADLASATLLGGGFLALAAYGLVWAARNGMPDVWMLLGLALAHLLASRVVFESTAGSAVATQPVLVVALLTLPGPLVPVVVAFGLIASSPVQRSRGGAFQLLVAAASGWHCLGGLLVLSMMGEHTPGVEHWRWYLLALLTQFAIDAAVAVVRCLAVGLRIDVLLGPLAWMYGVDALLAPIGLTAVVAAGSTGWAIALAMAPVGVLALLSRDRAETFERAVTISGAVEEALRVARTDPLTGLPNRRAWNEAVANAAVVFAADAATEIAVVVADVDGLKSLNDEFGHDAGDDYLRSVADLLRRATPDDAHVARLGGDEFGVLVVAGSVDLDELVEQVEVAVAAAPPVRGSAVALTLGGAACPPSTDVESACRAADERLIERKAAGRDGRQASIAAPS